MRRLRVLVFFEKSLGEVNVRYAFDNTSESLGQQVGITLDVTLVAKAKLEARSYHELFSLLRKWRRGAPAYDLVVGIVPRRGLPDEECVPGTCAVGMVNEWRNIGLRTLRSDVIVHEIGHTLMMFETHSLHGVMTSGIESPYFTRRDRELILKNKWRDFRRQPNLIERCLLFC